MESRWPTFARTLSMWVASAYATATVSATPTSNLISFLDIAAESPFSKKRRAFFYRRTARMIFHKNFLNECRETKPPERSCNLAGWNRASSYCRTAAQILRSFGTPAAARQRSRFAATRFFLAPHPARNRLPLPASMWRQRRAARRTGAPDLRPDQGSRIASSTLRPEATRLAEELAAGCIGKQEYLRTPQFLRLPECGRES